MKKKNRIDEKMNEKSVEKKRYPKSSSWDMYQSLLRDPLLTKLLLLDLEKFYKKVFRDWSDFWDLCCDFNPLFCFICGKYIIPKMRDDKARIKKPYKNGDVCHEYCWGKEMTVERSLGKLNTEAELICHLDLGWSISGSVCRDRVKNNPKEIIEHLVSKHGWSATPELARAEIKEGRYTHTDWSKKFKEDVFRWFHDNQLNYEQFRNNHFLKPNGKPFPQRRDF